MKEKTSGHCNLTLCLLQVILFLREIIVELISSIDSKSKVRSVSVLISQGFTIFIYFLKEISLYHCI